MTPTSETRHTRGQHILYSTIDHVRLSRLCNVHPRGVFFDHIALARGVVTHCYHELLFMQSVAAGNFRMA